MKKKKAIGLTLLLVITVATVAYKPTERYFEIAKSLDIFATLFKEVNAYYVDEVDPQKLIRKSIDSMLESLDPYTDFIPEDELENFKVFTTGQYAGIGAEISEINGKTIIMHPYKNFPAGKAGVKVGDEIIAIDGKSTQNKSSAEVSAMLKGPAKTEVDLKIKRVGHAGEINLKIKREKITISNLAYAGIVDSNIAYIKLDDFTPGASKEVADALVSLKDQGAKKLILDLRDNPGGLMHEAINIVNLFVPRGVEVVSTKGKVPEWNKSYATLNNPLDTEIPIAVLISEGSASASEIVAGSLQDYDRAILVGTRTFGKGLVQTTRQLSYNAQLKVTTAKYHIPSGRCIQALDYAHRNEDGTVEKFPDSLRSEFKTKNGRSVYDGNGINPDVTVDDDFLAPVTIALLSNRLIFEYASKYCGEHPVVPNLKAFSITDAEYSKFTEWVKTKGFSYKTGVEASVEELIEIAREERSHGDVEKLLTDLKRKIDTDKTSDLSRFKEEISRVLEQQIAFHYALTEGLAAVSLHRDPTVLQAKSLLNDSNRYKNILSTIQ